MEMTFRGRIDALKVRGLSKVIDVRDGAKSQVMKVQDSMRSNPLLWAGIAAGAGLGIGLIGRVAQFRRKQRNRMPDLVIIEAGC